METIEINVIGLQHAGKSTLTNALTGTNYSKQNTEVESVFCVGKFDPSMYTSPKDVEDVLNKEEVYIPYYDNFGLSKDWNYFISDYVGITSKRINKDKSIKLLDEQKYVYDLYIVVCDITTFDREFDRIMDILSIINQKRHDPSNIVVVLNKCDSIIYSEKGIVYSNLVEEEMVKSATSKLNEIGFNNVIPFCAKLSMLFSAGENSMFCNETENKMYEAQTEDISPSKLLKKSGFYHLTTFINNFLDKNKNKLINKHVLNELFSGKNHSIEKITSIILRIKDAEDDIATKVKEEVMRCIDNFPLDDFDDAQDIKISYFESIVDKLKSTYNSVFVVDSSEIEEKCKKLVKHVAVKYYNMLLTKSYNDDAINKLYEYGLLTQEKLEMIVSMHITNDNIVKTLLHISKLTNHDVNYLFYVLNEYVKTKNKSIAFLLKTYELKDNILDYIRVKILYGSKSYLEFYNDSFDEFTTNKALLATIDSLFMTLSTKIYDDFSCDTSKESE